MRAISYARASQDRTGQELSVDRQLEDHRALSSARQWELVAELIDNDVSAAGRKPRPAFERALEMVRTGHADMIVATDMSRLTRGKARDEVRLLELGLETGLRLSFVRAPDLDLSNAAGRLTASILIAAARHEIEQKSERQQRAALQAAQQGRRIGGRRPFGYDADGVTIREVEAAAVQGAYEALLSGVSLGRIAREWNERGLATPQSKRDGSPSWWSSQTVRQCLLNPRYAGLRARGRQREIMAVAQWPALIAESTWRAAVAVLSDPGRVKAPRSGRSLLTGIARCGVCGATVHAGAAPSRRGREGWRTYRCRAAYGHVGRAAQPVEDFVSAVAVERLSRPDATDLLVDHDRADVNDLRARAVELRQRRQTLVTLVADGTFSEAEARVTAAQLAGDLADVEAQLADAGRVDVLGGLVTAADTAAAWAELDLDRRRSVIDALMVVTLHPPGRGVRTFRPETVGIEWKT